MAGFARDIRDQKGEIIHIFYGNMGLNSNNSTELEGMVASLMIVDRNNILLVIMEGDLAIILSLATKILYGSLVSKVTSSWRLVQGLRCLLPSCDACKQSPFTTCAGKPIP